MTKETLSARVSESTLNRLERYADETGISKSEGTDRLLTQGLDVEESDMRLVPVKTDGGTVIEERLDEIDEDIQSVERKSNDLTRVGILIVISLLWMGVEETIGFPLWVTVITGMALVVALLHSLFKQYEVI